MSEIEDLVEPDAEAALQEIYRIKAEVAELEARRRELQEELAQHHLHGEKMLFLDDEGNKHTAQMIITSVAEVDAEGLRSEVHPYVFEQVATYKVNANKLSEAIESGLIPANIAKRHVSYKPRKPYVKF